MRNALWTIFAILVGVWLVGLILRAGGQLIHLALLAAVVVLVINLMRRAAT